MFKTNEIIINGRSSADLPFPCAVEELDPPQRAEKKDKVFESDFVSGYLKQSIEAYSGKVKKFKIYLYDIDPEGFNLFKEFIADYGTLVPYNEPHLTYHFVKSTIELQPMDLTGGYEATVEFYCQPFGMEEERTLPLDSSIENKTNAPMYPLIKLTGQTSQPTFLQIGKQRMEIKEIQGILFIECQHGKQNAYTTGGKLCNNHISGDFFMIPSGKHLITKGQGIAGGMITCRWGWR